MTAAPASFFLFQRLPRSVFGFKRFLITWCWAAAVALAGCANLAPDYTRPAAAVPHTGQAVGREAASLSWQQFFSNERLQGTVALALANNRDLRVAALNVEKARAALRVTDAARLPTVTAGLSTTNAQASGSTQPSSTSTAQLALASYEIDLFSRLKNLSVSAQQSLLASDETRRSTQISLVAEVANAWLTLATDLQRQRLAQQTLDSRERTLALVSRQYALGSVTGLELSQAESSLASARVETAAYPATLAQDRNALELLLGAALPETLAPRAEDVQRSVSALVDLPEGVPSSVLLQRPDVLAAEHALMASHADIGAARAALFPKISLTAAAGSASSALAELFSAGTRSWSYTPAVSVPLFDGGANRAAVRKAEVAREIALATYDKTVQTAFSEVANALAVRATLSERLAAQQAWIASTERQLRLAEAQYRHGATTLLDVLDAQRTYVASQQSFMTLQLTEQSNRVALYKVLGGGWNTSPNPN